jgi:hypothetical protein
VKEAFLASVLLPLENQRCAGVLPRLNAHPDYGFPHSTTTLCSTPRALNLTPSYCLRVSTAYRLTRSNVEGKLILMFQMLFLFPTREIKLNVLVTTISVIHELKSNIGGSQQKYIHCHFNMRYIRRYTCINLGITSHQMQTCLILSCVLLTIDEV